MAKGSQLLQLKTALSQAGVTGHPQGGKKRKRSAHPEKDKEKKAARLQEIHQKLNPFDVKVTKLKHDVGGRKLKGVTGRPAQSKQAGIEQRKKTLLKEYEEKGRAGGIVDRRFGENDPSMSLEERMLERFTKERQRASKGAAFNLEDEDELTHYGQSLSKLDDFDNVGLGLEDDDEDAASGQIEKEIVKRTHFGGFGEDGDDDEVSEEPARKKSKAEVMAEVMNKSKEHRLRRQMEKEQEDNVRHQLDEDFDSLRDLLYAPDPSSTGSNSVPLGRPSTETSTQLKATELAPVPQDLDYDQQVRELAFDKRAKPKDRTKTEEELAIEEKEALEIAERKRRKRMLGLDDSDTEDENASRKKRRKGGDDLEDDFAEDDDEWDGLGPGLGNGLNGAGAEDASESEDDENGGSEGSEEGSGSDSEQSSDDSEVEAGEHEELVPSSQPGKGKAKQGVSSYGLPFTFPCPATHEEFLGIINGVDDADVPTVVKRIRTLHHASLAPENKFKLQALATVLVDHILYITAPLHLAEFMVGKLALMHKNLKRGLSRGPLDQTAKTWPGLPELSFLRILGAIWPTSDLNHAVISPTRILIGAYLGLCRVRSLADIASGLFLCTLSIQFEELSKRYIPEAVSFLTNTVLFLAPHSYEAPSLPGSFPSPDFGSELCQSLAIKPGKKLNDYAARKANLVELLTLKQPNELAKLDLLNLSFQLLGKCAEMHKGLDGFIEIYEPVLQIFQHVHERKKLPENLQAQLSSKRDMLGRLLKFAGQSRQPLCLQAHKPIPIPSYIPKFEATTSSYLRRQDPDHEKNETSKLRSQYKQERKGAIRELRKDARFLAGVEQQKQREKDHEYSRNMKRVFGSIEGERAEEKAMEREKSREKRRAGRK
ncbi:nucleolar protein 14 [Infundibulicybe gibba]|nr:nucleolar protein 14 [Infundibulicybe gibba]